MKISKTQFMNYIRCPRYMPLEEVYRSKSNAVVSFSDEYVVPEEEKVKVLWLIELEDRKKDILSSMFDEETGADLIDDDDVQADTMLPYYNEIEMISGKLIRKRFTGEVIYGKETFQQKLFEAEYNDYCFYCFLDGYQNDEKSVRVFETKATTSKKFLDLGPMVKGVKDSIFGYSPQGILMLKEELGLELSNKYQENRLKLLDRMHVTGKYVYDLAYQRFVLEKALKTTKELRFYLVVLDSTYIHDGEVANDGQAVYPDEMMVMIDLTTITKELQTAVKKDVDFIVNNFSIMNASEVPLGKHCQRKDPNRKCQFYDVCYKKVPAVNSVFNYISGHYGFTDPDDQQKYSQFDLINNLNIINLTDVPIEWLEEKDNQKIQHQVVSSNTEYFHEDRIKKGIMVLQYPIYHLDFESFPCPIPRFKDEKPYSQSLFQYSVHIEHEPGVCDKIKDNYGFIAKDHTDQRLQLLEGLLDVIKDDAGSILVYNVGFERGRLKELAHFFPVHRKRIERIIDRLFDLLNLVKGNSSFYQELGLDKVEASGINYYHKDLNGSFSIKKVLPIFSELSYQGMKIGNGTDAMVAYARFPIMKEYEFKQSYQDLWEYCKQDTWAMYEVLNSLRGTMEKKGFM